MDMELPDIRVSIAARRTKMPNLAVPSSRCVPRNVSAATNRYHDNEIIGRRHQRTLRDLRISSAARMKSRLAAIVIFHGWVISRRSVEEVGCKDLTALSKKEFA
jgi:hypothetical protein